MKYKVGDKVVVRPDLMDNKLYGGMYFIESIMGSTRGKSCTIRSSNNINAYELYELEECKGYRYFTDEILLPLGVEISLKEMIDFLES